MTVVGHIRTSDPEMRLPVAGGITVDEPGLSSRSPETTASGSRQCVFCLEDIRPGASVCPHCGSALAPLQMFADKLIALETKLVALELDVAALRDGRGDQLADPAAPVPAPTETPNAVFGADIRWPHMVDNIFLGLATLLAAHWLATTLPSGGRTGFRLVALVVALPFGIRFEQNSRTGPTGQVLAALAFGSIGTLAIGLLDLSVAGHGVPPPTAQDIIASVAAISLSHFAGSALAHSRHMRAARAVRALTVQSDATAGAVIGGSRIHIQPAQIKGTADAVKALYEAAAPLAAGAAALWAAFGHLLF
jgi:hypothetical protein